VTDKEMKQISTLDQSENMTGIEYLASGTVPL